MKKILLSLFTVALSVATVFAQAPEKMNYQGVARDNSGNVLPNQAVGLQVKLHSGTSGGAVVYSETHAISTNAFGLFNVQIGTGSNVTGTFNTIGWGANAFYVEVLMDASGGTSYTSMGTQQLVSVPYALNAKSAANVSGTTNYVSKFTSVTTLGNSQIFDNGTNVGIGTAGPTSKFHIDNGSLFVNSSAGEIKLGYPSADGWAFGTIGGGQDLQLWDVTAGSNEAVRVFFEGGSGNVGLGTTAPSYNLTVYEPSSYAVMNFQNSTTGNSDYDGFMVGHDDATGNNANVWNWEDGFLQFGTNGNSRMRILANGNVGINQPAPTSQLHVVTNTTDGASSAIFGKCNHTGNIDSDGLRGENTVAGWYGYGVSGYGGWYGGSFDATVAGTGSRYGVAGYAGGTSSASYGVFGTANGTGTNYAGYFSGDVYSTGAYLPSDANLKNNVKDYSNAMAMINTIPVRSYNYKSDGIFGKMSLPKGDQVGIMAQDLEQVFPQLVKEAYFEDTRSVHDGLVKKEDMESINYKAVNYTGLVPVMIKAMQEQNLVIQKLQERIKALEAK